MQTLPRCMCGITLLERHAAHNKVMCSAEIQIYRTPKKAAGSITS